MYAAISEHPITTPKDQEERKTRMLELSQTNGKMRYTSGHYRVAIMCTRFRDEKIMYRICFSFALFRLEWPCQMGSVCQGIGGRGAGGSGNGVNNPPRTHHVESQ